jgi:hypothetical protein
MLPLVKNKGEIQRNIVTLDDYLKNENSCEGEYAKGLIQKGKCFVIIGSPNGYRFYPSRFMGYVDNSMEKHEKMVELKRSTGKITRDGRNTTPKISGILGDLIKKGNKQWGHWEAEYKKFCNKLDITPDNNARKFWDPVSG